MRHTILLIATLLAGAAHAQNIVSIDVPYVPTPEPVVEKMLEMARVDSNDVIYDLGSGDGRIVIAAAKKYGARGVGVEIDPQLIGEARDNARAAGVADRVEFREGNLFEMDFSDATIVTLYLQRPLNLRLRPKLLRELKPGTRIVSHSFDMGDWAPADTARVEGRNIYYWVVPKSPPESH
ncbi:MAG: methyltransferase domain-containing protein [Pseudomonadota bacterium]|nr:methyltransferase domain-containing protein [Pseudomonadota bacterium]